MDEFGLGAEEAPEQPAAPAEEDFGLGAEEPKGVSDVDTPKPEAEEKPKEVEAKDEVPESYTFDGQESKFNEAVGAVAKELGMSQDKAQKFANAVDEANINVCYEHLKRLVAKTKADPEIGGAKFDYSVAAVRGLFDRFIPDAEGRKELKDVFHMTGIGSHPEFIRMMVRISKALPPESGKQSHFKNSFME